MFWPLTLALVQALGWRARPPPLRDARLCWLGAALAAQGFVIAAMATGMLDLLAGDRLAPQRLGALTFGLLPAGLLLPGIGSPAVAGCIAFVVMYGAGLGLLTLVRAAAPLRLFGPGPYALVAGALATPAVLARAAGSAAYAMAWRGRALRPPASAG
ncbi:hypothetical protein [Aquincola sp. J276]|uniref:hypothetical protein n=1 Tax=Aquincola sp. J276 TaxID=2898432 RepID=UPI002151A42A|nr:hypothetical protein [Aquincola sp. J276]MCR5865001.1 hypothetical protein [Aquincola sp. J276]